MTADEIDSLIKRLSNMSAADLQIMGIGPDQIAAMEEYLAMEKQLSDAQAEATEKAIEDIKKENDERRRAFEHRKKELDYLNATERITDEERKTKLLAILNEELLYENSVMEILRNQKATHGDI